MSLKPGAGQTGKVTPYSFRHGIARLMKRRRVDLEDIGTFMGHKHKGANRTTAIYVPDDPEYLRDAAAVIEDIMQEIKRHLKNAIIDDPASSLRRLESIPRRNGSKLTQTARSEMLAMIKAGRPAGEIRKIFDVSYEAVYKHRRKLGLK